MTDHDPRSHVDGGGQWLAGTDVPTFFVPALGQRVVVVFLRAGAFDEPLALTGITEVALRAAVAGLPSGHAVRELRVEGLLSTIVLAGADGEVGETLRQLATALNEPDAGRIHGELQRAKSRMDQRAHGPRQLHLAKRFGTRGPGALDLPQYGAFKATPDEVQALAGRLFVGANAALLVLGTQPSSLSFGLARGDRLALPEAITIEAVTLPAQAFGAYGDVSASLELPRSFAGRLAFEVLTSRLEARGTAGDLSAAVEQVSERALIGIMAAPVADAFIQKAGTALVQETSDLARTAPTDDELQRVRAAWLAKIGASPYVFGWFVVSQMLLGSRLETRSDLVNQLWEIGPDDVSLTAQLMTQTMLLLLPEGVEIDERLIARQQAPEPSARVKGRRFRPIGAAIDWEASARGSLFVGGEGVSQVTKAATVATMLFDDVELLIDYDDGVIVLVGSASWLQVDPRLWKGGESVRSAILSQVPPDRVVPVPKGERAVTAGERAIAKERRTARRSLIKALAILVGTLAFVGPLAWWGSDRDEIKPQGKCAAIVNGRVDRVDCDASVATARVLAITSYGSAVRRDCPPQTDDIVAMADSFTEYGCLRRLDPPHPGDRGQGGGVLLAGDCIANPSEGLAQPEVKCGSERDWATVAATAVNRSRCSQPAVDFVNGPTGASKPILCLARGPGIITAGDCVTDQTVTELLKVRCGAPEAAFRVVARVAAQRRCRSGGETALVPRALPRAAIACLRRA